MAEISKLYYILSTTAALGAVTAIAYLFKHGVCQPRDRPINPIIKKNEKKVTDVFDIEDLIDMIKPGEKISFCRCWRSKEWPYCDGVHKEHNQCTGDNVGALNIVRKKTDIS
uniref:Iron-binding zinc finger CDGSH type domain-containing protein n=1 Tax=Arion vulgaris TaxID=1028688 RepID=A0A0B6YV41_9EUPU